MRKHLIQNENKKHFRIRTQQSAEQTDYMILSHELISYEQFKPGLFQVADPYLLILRCAVLFIGDQPLNDRLNHFNMQ